MPLLLATEAAAIEACKWLGKNNQNMADQAAVSAMRQKLNAINFSGIIKIGEGERDKAPMLSIGEKVGLRSTEQPTIDIAVDPLEGTNACAKGTHGAMSVLALANHNCILHAPDVYMQKIVTNEDVDPESVSMNYSVRNNLHAIAMQKEKKIDELKIIVLDRPRHSDIIQQIRQLKASVMLITDGDIAAAISVALGQADAYIGIGGAPEGFLAASAVKCLNGNIQGKLIFDDDQSIARAKAMGISDTNAIYHANDMIMGQTLFVASAITSTLEMQPIHRESGQLSIESLIMCSEDNSITNIQNTYFI